MTKETKFVVELAKLLDKHDSTLCVDPEMSGRINLEFDIKGSSSSNILYSGHTDYDITSTLVLNNLIGKTATAEHPITCANPDLEFIITDVKLDRGILFVRGENTMWFGESMINIK